MKMNQKELNRILFYAVILNDLEVIKKVIADGADVNAKDGQGDTPLRYAEKAGNLETVDLLKQQGG